MSEQRMAQLTSIKGIGPKRSSHIVMKLQELDKSLDSLFNMPSQEIKEIFGLPQNVAEAISEYRSVSVSKERKAPANELDKVFSERDIKTLQLSSPDYPQHLKQMLGENAPKQLYVWGNLDLLNKPAVGFCGSRDVTEKGLRVTQDTAQQIIELGWVVISGHARGVDATAHRTALENGGGTIIVLPQGILSFKLRAELKRIAKPEQLLIVSEFSPKAQWNVGYAMQRNQTIIGLSDAMILVQARMEGGTFNAGKTALKLKSPLFVAQYEMSATASAGNEHFIKRGARPLLKSGTTGKANITELRQSVEKKQESQSGSDAQPHKAEQLSLGL